MNSALLTGTAKIDELFFNGSIKPILAGIDLSFLTLNASGSISGLTANLDINQSLGYIHKLQLNNPFSFIITATISVVAKRGNCSTKRMVASN